eukprot:766572-Rhodomonas_salina.1
MKQAAAAHTIKGQPSPLILAGKPTQYLPSGTTFKPPAILRFTLDQELKRQISSAGLKTEVGIFAWKEDEDSWKEMSNVSEVSSSEGRGEYEVESDSFSVYCIFYTWVVKPVRSFIRQSKPELYCFGMVDKETILPGDEFAFTVHFCPTEPQVVTNSAQIVNQADNVVEIQAPTRLRVELKFPNPPNLSELKDPAQNSDGWTQISDRFKGAVTSYLRRDGNGEMYVTAD